MSRPFLLAHDCHLLWKWLVTSRCGVNDHIPTPQDVEIRPQHKATTSRSPPGTKRMISVGDVRLMRLGPTKIRCHRLPVNLRWVTLSHYFWGDSLRFQQDFFPAPCSKKRPALKGIHRGKVHTMSATCGKPNFGIFFWLYEQSTSTKFQQPSRHPPLVRGHSISVVTVLKNILSASHWISITNCTCSCRSGTCFCMGSVQANHSKVLTLATHFEIGRNATRRWGEVGMWFFLEISDSAHD